MPASPSSSVLVVGAGIVGLCASWRLAEQGEAVTLIDPQLGQAGPAAWSHQELSGSGAALGVLMAQLFQRSSGRAWRLRQQSQALWEQWIPVLERRGHRLPRRPGVLVLAGDEETLARQERIAADRQRLGLPLRRLGPAELERLHPSLPGPPLGALLSPQDGQLDPRPLLEALRCEGQRAGVVEMASRVEALERGRHGGWRVVLGDGARREGEWLVLALGLGTQALLAGIGHALPLEPVLGQALELELAADPGWTWPGTVVWRGCNLVPRPDLAGGRRLWLGATLEPGRTGSPAALAELRDLGGEAPSWLRQARVMRHWQGWRCRPQGRPAPVLEELEPGLLVASGHHRNGVLLAPASAAWLADRISRSGTAL